jgi:low temperature requirement protein LtrA
MTCADLPKGIKDIDNRLYSCMESIEKERHASWLENFYDLIVAIVVFQLSSNLNHDVSISGFVGFIALFIPVLWSWMGVTFYNTRFETDDLGHRLRSHFCTWLQLLSWRYAFLMAWVRILLDLPSLTRRYVPFSLFSTCAREGTYLQRALS